MNIKVFMQQHFSHVLVLHGLSTWAAVGKSEKCPLITSFPLDLDEKRHEVEKLCEEEFIRTQGKIDG